VIFLGQVELVDRDRHLLYPLGAHCKVTAWGLPTDVLGCVSLAQILGLISIFFGTFNVRHLKTTQLH
jgi:hypothetical protein